MTQRDRALRRLRTVFLLSWLLPLLGYALVSAYLYRENQAEARMRLDRSVRIAQEHALKMFETNQMLLKRMLDLVARSTDEEILARSEEIHRRLNEMAEGLPQVQGLYINSSDGRSLGTNRVHPPPRQIDYRDREWYVAHRSGTEPQVFVTEQIISRATGEPFFGMSRRRVGRDGSFAGTVHVSLRPEYLTSFYAELATQERGLNMAIVRDDGKLVARWPREASDSTAIAADHRLMAMFKAGRVVGEDQGVSPFDGIDRIRLFRKLDPSVNARDAMPQGGWLQISARNAQAGEYDGSGKAMVVIEAADSGTGMDAATAARAFEPFFTTKPLGRGTGLGLSQVQTLAQSAGGDARLAARAEGGTRVLLFLQAQAAPMAEEAADDDAPIPHLAHLGYRVLMVEDNESVAEATTNLLHTVGCSVEHVSHGAAAIEFLAWRAAEIDVVLSDIEMPGGMDGIELASLLRQLYPALPVVLVTGYAARIEQAAKEKLEVLPKPCPPALLVETLAEVVERQRRAQGGA